MTKQKKRCCCAMSPEQEKEYTVVCAERILQYDWILLIIMIGIQLYNICYVYQYTKGRLHTVPSRVYTVFYLILLSMCIAGIILRYHLKRNMPDRAMMTVRFQRLFCIFLLIWGGCVTVYDQRTSDNINAYLVIALTVAMVVFFHPVQALAVYFFIQIVMMFAIPVFQEQITDNNAKHVNMAVVTTMAIFMCWYRYSSSRKHFLDQQTILEQNRQLSRLAERDSLTNLRNRRFLNQEMTQLYQQCVENKIPMTVMMMDIDFFKHYNDTFGHQQGDECLRRMAWRLEQELVEEKEYLIRYGGEEFLYVSSGMNAQEAENRAEQFNDVIRKLIMGPSRLDPRGITISIGICTRVPSKSAEEQEWIDYIAEADRALYMAKDQGRDKWVAV